MNQNNTSVDWVSILALLSSITFGILNFFYTKRTFAASNYPQVELEIESALCANGTCLRYKLRNHSTEKSVIKGVLTVYLKSPFRKWYHIVRKRSLIFQEKNLEIKPQEQIVFPKNIEEYDNSIDSLLADQFPQLVKKRTTHKGRELFLVDPHRYFDCIIHFEYEPSIFGAISQILKFEYRITPSPKSTSTNQFRLNFWKVDRLK